MSLDLSVSVSSFALAGSWFALLGTNAQAALAKQKLLTDSNPIVQAAARLWTAGRRRVIHRGRRRLQNVFEQQLQEQHPREWQRYQVLKRELRAWNAVESGVAMLFASALLAFMDALF